MATICHVPVEVYLSTSYRPDAEFLDGEVLKRSMGEYDHSAWQEALLLFFSRHRQTWNTRAKAELRVQVSPTRYRVPDVVLLDRDAPAERIITRPPLAVFEIVSPEDTLTRMIERLADYERMGVRGIWLLDPRGPRLQYEHGKLTPVEVCAVAGTKITFRLEEVERLLD